MRQTEFKITIESFIPNNLTKTFGGIGYVLVDVNSVVLWALTRYRLNKKQLPGHTVRQHFKYVTANLAVSSLPDQRYYYELTGDAYFDALIAMLDDGTFYTMDQINRAATNDRIGFVYVSLERKGLVEYANRNGLYVVLQEQTYFEYSFVHSLILKPYTQISGGSYQVMTFPGENVNSDADNNSIKTNYLAMNSSRKTTVKPPTHTFEIQGDIVFEDYESNVPCEVAEDLVRDWLSGNQVFYDGRIAAGRYHEASGDTENAETLQAMMEKIKNIMICPICKTHGGRFKRCLGCDIKTKDIRENPNDDKSGKDSSANISTKSTNAPISNSDLDLIIPVIPEKPNLKHLANIRRSALSMYECLYQYSTIQSVESVEKKRTSGKVQKIIETNRIRMTAEKRKKDNEWLEIFFGTYERLNGLAAKRRFLEGVKMDNAYINGKLLLLRIELYGKLWELEMKKPQVDERVLVPLYLACIEYFETRVMKNENLANERNDKEFLAETEFVVNSFVSGGFKATVCELIERYSLPIIVGSDGVCESATKPSDGVCESTKVTTKPSDIDLYFQLKFLGEHLKRTLGTRKDSRVPFEPDLWQVNLLDAVDRGDSAVVAAPTSSGKTFACFYAIERVLRNSDTDVVIFCLPTKALANQVSADIYARFTPKNCRMALQGILMNDRCSEPFTCQVLITIPSMLEALLNSCVEDSRLGRNAMVTSRIKYIIIDEVHKINDPAIGLSIERIIYLAQCPMLLLSATIGNIEAFYAWFSEIELVKGRRSSLITHSERYSELKPYVWSTCDNKASTVSDALVGDNTNESINEDKVNKNSDSVADSTDMKESINEGKAKLVPLNCMFAYSFNYLREFGFGNDIHFLPEELLNLYYYIYMILRPEQKRLIKKLAPKNFFKSNIISKAEVKQYEIYLLRTFEAWVRGGVLGEDQVAAVYDLLVGDTLDAFPRDFDEKYLIDNLLPLLRQLHDEDKLPVIVFNTDRELLSRMARAVHGQLEEMDVRGKKDRFAERLRKEAKRVRDNEKTRTSWIEDSIASEQQPQSNTRDIRCTFLDATTKLSDAEVREELSEVRTTPRHVLDMVYRGIGIHHAGMERRYRSAIEILFRKKHVRVIFATETLALGINMPCRTVVFAGDSLELDPMNYKQMAGRAGRRGYDTLGNVVYLGLPRNRVQNLMVSMLPEIKGLYTYSNSSLVSFNIEDTLIRHSLLGNSKRDTNNDTIETSNNMMADTSNNNIMQDNIVSSTITKLNTLMVNTENIEKKSDYVFNHYATEELRRRLVNFQKTHLPSIYPANYLWDFYVSNRSEDTAVFLFGLLVHANKIQWDPNSLILTIAHLFEIRPCLSDYPSQLLPLPTETSEFIADINAAYKSMLYYFQSSELRTLARLSSEPLHYIRSFLYTIDVPKNNYIYEFFRHGSAQRILIKNGVHCGDLWQSLYRIDYMLASLIKLFSNYFSFDDPRIKKLNAFFKVFHDQFKCIFS